MKKTFVNFLVALSTAALLAGCDSEAKRSTENNEAATSANVQTTSQDQAANQVQGARGANVTDAPAMKFEQTEYDFGTIQEGDIVKHTFVFTNTGNAPLIVQSATAQCGCTVPQKPEKPVAPGEKGEIKVEFNSKGKLGVQSKSITITANTQPEITQVYIKGTVEQGVASMNGPLRTN